MTRAPRTHPRRPGPAPGRRTGAGVPPAAVAATVLLAVAVPCRAAADIFYYRASMDSLSTPVVRLSVSDTVRAQTVRPPKPAPHAVPTVTDKVHPRLRTQLMGTPDDDTVTVFVTLRDTVDIASPALLQFQKQALRDTLIALRRADYDTLRAQFDARYGARELQRYWMIRALLVRMPAGAVDSLAARPDVIRLEPARGGAPPDGPSSGGPPGDDTMACGSSGTPVRAARDLLGTDRYVDAGYGRGDIALLDTGLRTSHVTLAGTGRIRNLYTCQTELGVCAQDPDQTDTVTQGHGTASAAILMGAPVDPLTGEGVDADRGITQATITSYKVYDEDDSLSFAGTTDAFQMALVEGVPTIVAEIAVTGGGDVGAISELAGQAFARDQVVIAAMGNNGTTLTSPAGAAEVFGVGAYCVGSGYFYSEYVRGRTLDGRYKPDATGPTAVYTASNTSYQTGVDDDHGMLTFGGTSCATAVIGGAAHLLRNRLSAGQANPAPAGAVYAVLLLAADVNATVDDTLEGAGRIRLPGTGVLEFGEVDVAEHELVSLPVSGETAAIAEGKILVSAAIWWPEPDVNELDPLTTATRSDIDLLLLDERGRLVDSSLDRTPVHERVDAAGSFDDTRWTVQVYGARVPVETRKVYWAAWIRSAESGE